MSSAVTMGRFAVQRLVKEWQGTPAEALWGSEA